MVKSRDFDRLLLRPRGTALQVAAQEIQLMRVGRFLPGLLVLGWAVLQRDVPWHDVRWLGVVSGVLAGAAVFYGLFILQATLAFWTVESLEVMNTMTHGGVEVAQYPMSIYRPWFRTFFTLVVPLACTTYFPVRSLLLPSARPDAFLQTCLPLGIGALFLGVTLRLWSVGVRHYRSTGS